MGLNIDLLRLRCVNRAWSKKFAAKLFHLERVKHELVTAGPDEVVYRNISKKATLVCGVRHSA